MNKLTDRACATAKAEGKELRLFDGLGLYLAVRPSGSKSWKWKYRFQGREKKLTLGPYPLLSLKQARDERDKARLALLDGTDPGAAKQETRRRVKLGETFEEIARSWHASRKDKLTPRYHAEILRRLEADAFPHFGREAIGDVTAPMVLDAMRKVEQRGAKTMAHDIRGHISEVFAWAIASGLAEFDPAAMIRKALNPAPTKRFAAVLKIEQARDLIKALDARDGRRMLTATKLASRLLALTAIRPGVLRQAEVTEFEQLDGAQPIWRVPAAKMKLLKDQKDDPAFDFIVPLSRQAVETVKAAMENAPGNRFLFPGATGKSAISDATLSQIYLDAGYRGRHVPHGWRSTFSTIMNERAEELERPGDQKVIDLMLAHVKGDIEARYNRAAYMPRRRTIAQEWADLLMEGIAPPDSLLKR